MEVHSISFVEGRVQSRVFTTFSNPINLHLSLCTAYSLISRSVQCRPTDDLDVSLDSTPMYLSYLIQVHSF